MQLLSYDYLFILPEIISYYCLLYSTETNYPRGWASSTPCTCAISGWERVEAVALGAIQTMLEMVNKSAIKVVNLLGLNGTYNYCGLCSKPFCRMRLARFQPASISWDGIQLWPKKPVITGEQKPHLSDMFHQLQELTRPMAITVDGYNCGRCFDIFQNNLVKSRECRFYKDLQGILWGYIMI